MKKGLEPLLLRLIKNKGRSLKIALSDFELLSEGEYGNFEEAVWSIATEKTCVQHRQKAEKRQNGICNSKTTGKAGTDRTCLKA
ncbi:MAG: hypothetical protein PUK16_01175 [Prevotellaceae bacterium]|nr:hypothetical protein [Prevotellaceae bacterium]